MKDLIKLYSFHSPHNSIGEQEICDWIEKRIKQIRKGISLTRDGNSLIYMKKGNKVMLSAHLDQVETNGKCVHIYKQGDNIIGYNKYWERTNLGADDKNGVWVILKLLQAGYNFDFVISEGEEVGCIGIEKLEKRLPESTAEIAIVIDRRKGDEVLKGGGSDVYCSTLAQSISNFFKGAFKVTTGSISDTRVICKYMESVNISAGYYGAHTSTEFTNFKELENIKNCIERIVDGTFVHYPTPPSQYVYTPKPSTLYNNNSNKKGRYNYDELWYN